jgi:hypothetical protein
MQVHLMNRGEPSRVYTWLSLILALVLIRIYIAEHSILLYREHVPLLNVILVLFRGKRRARVSLTYPHVGQILADMM